MRRIFATAFALLATQAFAFGPEGHAVVADIAAAHLTPAAARQVGVLLQGESDPTLAGVASWADDVRRSAATGKWHFVNLGNDCDYQPARDCPQGQCIVAALSTQTTILADTTQSLPARRDALKYVVHLAGDIGQPLHDIDHGDKGGNDYQVSLDGRGTNLHKVWDSEIIKTLDHGAEKIAQDLTPDPGRPVEFTAPSQFDPQAWAQEACSLVDAVNIYPAGHKIDKEYITEYAPVVRTQLQKSGERLAAILNQALGGVAP